MYDVPTQAYVELIQSFVEGSISAEDFEARYLETFKGDGTPSDEPRSGILDNLFVAVDAFVSDPDLRDEGDLDPEGLRAEAVVALEKLRALGPRASD